MFSDGDGSALVEELLTLICLHVVFMHSSRLGFFQLSSKFLSFFHVVLICFHLVSSFNNSSFSLVFLLLMFLLLIDRHP